MAGGRRVARRGVRLLRRRPAGCGASWPTSAAARCSTWAPAPAGWRWTWRPAGTRWWPSTPTPTWCAACAARARDRGLPVRAHAADARSFDAGLDATRWRSSRCRSPSCSAAGAAARAMLDAVGAHLEPGGLLAVALADPFGGVPAGEFLPPLPDVLEVDGWVLSSTPVDVRDEGELGGHRPPPPGGLARRRADGGGRDDLARVRHAARPGGRRRRRPASPPCPPARSPPRATTWAARSCCWRRRGDACGSARSTRS